MTQKKKYLDFLDILLTAKDENGEGLTDLEIRNEVDTFLFEGHDTTASGISWTLYLLAKHTEIQNKAWTEIDDVLSGRNYLSWFVWFYDTPTWTSLPWTFPPSGSKPQSSNNHKTFWYGVMSEGDV